MMNKIRTCGTWSKSLLPLLIAFCSSAKADTVTLNITGNVLASACTVDVNDKVQTVDFGKISAASLSPAGSIGPSRPFSIRLTDCPETTSSVTMTVTGTTDPSSPSLFGAYVGSEYTGVAIKVKPAEAGWNDDSVAPSGGAALTKAIPSDTHSVTFAFDSRLQSTRESILAGAFSSSMLVSFTYQ